MKPALALAALCLLALAPAASAQAPLEIHVTVPSLDEKHPIPVGTTLSYISANVTLGCFLLGQAGASPQITLSFIAPAGVNISAAAVVPSAADCRNDATDSATFGTALYKMPLLIKASDKAAGKVKLNAQATATLNTQAPSSTSTGPDEGKFSFFVDYFPCLKIAGGDVDLAKPIEVSGPALVFHVNLDFCGNARSMSMFDDVTNDCGAKVTGISPHVKEAPAQDVMEVTFNAPSTPWTTCNISFHNYVHYLDTQGSAGPGFHHQNLTWTMKNVAPSGTLSSGAPTTTKKSDALQTPLLSAGLLAVVAVALRRRV